MRIILLLVVGAFLASAQTVPPDVNYLPNDGVTGTANGCWIGLSSGKAIKLPTSALSGNIGLAIAGGGTTDLVAYVTRGVWPATLDNTGVVDNYVTISSSDACQGHDTGSSTRPTSGLILGRVVASGAPGGRYWVALAAADIVGSGVGGGDASTNTASSVDGEGAVFSGAGGKTLKRFTGTGVARGDSGVMSAAELSGHATTTGSNAVTLDVSMRRRACTFENDTQSATVLTTAQLTGRACQVPADATVAEIVVWASGGTGSLLFERFRPSDSTVADLLSGALATGASGAVACANGSVGTTCGITNKTSSGSITISNTSLTKGDMVRIKSATASGTETWFSGIVWYTVN